MDPLTILALAAATVQFVDFGARLLSSSTKTTETTDSEEDGVGAGSSKIASLESISHDVASLARQIKERMSPVRKMRGSQLSVSQANLIELCDRCQKIGDQVLAAVSEVQGRPPWWQGDWEFWQAKHLGTGGSLAYGYFIPSASRRVYLDYRTLVKC
jgi:hypothetical protein